AGSVLHTGVVPVGGNHVTGDLAVGLRCDLDTAEAVKRAYGHSLQLTVPSDATVTLTPMGYEEPVAVPQRYLAEVIGPRAREMAMLIGAEIERSGATVLPGGAARCAATGTTAAATATGTTVSANDSAGGYVNFSDRMKMYGVDSQSAARAGFDSPRPRHPQREEAPMELDRTLEGNARIKV